MNNTEIFNAFILDNVCSAYDQFKTKPYYDRTMRKAMQKSTNRIEQEVNANIHGELDRIKMKERLRKKLEARKATSSLALSHHKFSSYI